MGLQRAHSIEPAPQRNRQTTWRTFLKAHWDVLASIDFTTVEVWTKGGLVTYYLFFVMEVAVRNTVREFLDHYHQERNHQVLANRIIAPLEEVGRSDGDVRRCERLGGTWRYYYRDAA